MDSESLALWIVQYLENLFNITIEPSDHKTDFVDLGIDSTGLIGLSVDMSDWLDHDIELEVFIENRTISDASQFIASMLSGNQ